MPKTKCGVCGLISGTQAAEVILERSGMRRKYLTMWCITCWITLCNVLEDQSVAFTEGLPLVTTKLSRLALKKVRVRTSKSTEHTGKTSQPHNSETHEDRVVLHFPDMPATNTTEN